MSDNNWLVYYVSGLRPGTDEEDAVARLAALLKCPEDRARKIVRVTNRAVKRGLTRPQAERYQAALHGVGMLVEMRQEPAAKPPAKPVDSPPQAANAKPQQLGLVPVESPVAGDGGGDDGGAGDLSGPQEGPADPDDMVRPVRVRFEGQGFEYFKIWIVNIFLTILTLGIYSAWAKVRNKRYFYGNTLIDGSSFVYTAQPLTILKGRLIAVAIFVVYSALSELLPMLGLVLALILLVFVPWLVVRSLRFNARNSVYRNVRFDFNGGTTEAVKVFVLWPLLVVPTLGLILPYLWYRQKRFVVGNSAYGTSGFSFGASAGDYYRVLLVAFLVVVVGAGLAAGAIALLGEAAGFVVTPLSLLAYLAVFGYVAAALGNLAFNFTRLERHSFESSLQPANMAWLYLSNTLMILLTLGLFIPWAKIRVARYRAQCLRLLVAGGLDHFVAVQQEKTSAFGEEMGEVFDFDVAAF